MVVVVAAISVDLHNLLVVLLMPEDRHVAGGCQFNIILTELDRDIAFRTIPVWVKWFIAGTPLSCTESGT